MRLCAVSDMHGILDFNIEPCDVLCICGDTIPLRIQGWTEPTFKWLRDEFLTWCNEQPCEEVLLIAGNHDIPFQRHEKELREIFKDTKVRYLLDEAYEYICPSDGKVVKFYGTPWCHQFGSWAFMDYTDEGLVKVYDKMPEDVDVLLSHDAPYGTSDVITDDVPWATGEHIGGPALRDAVNKKKPKLMFVGHLHSVTKEPQKTEGGTEVVNVSMVNEAYKLVYKPHYRDL